MHHSLLLLTSIIALTAASTIPKRGYGLDYVPAPGPIPYPSNAMWPAPQSVTNQKEYGLANDQQQPLIDCLDAYGSNQFYDSWDGNVCGEFGWFKGAANGDISTYDCYQTCATYLRYDGIEAGQKSYQCDFQRGMHGHCWMGYHPM